MPGTLLTKSSPSHAYFGQSAAHAEECLSADDATVMVGVVEDAAPESETQAAGAEPPSAARVPLFRLDAGWLFLLSGIVLLAAVVLIPAQHDLDEARWQRNRALAIESHRTERLDRYGAYLAAIRSDDQCVLLSLAATQLNVSPDNRIPLQPLADIERTSASVFPLLEPGELNLPPKPAAFDERNREGLSILERLSINNSSRLWLIAAGTLCTLLGLLPSAGRSVVRGGGEMAGSALGTVGTAIGAGAVAAAGEAVNAAREMRARIAEHDLAVEADEETSGETDADSEYTADGRHRFDTAVEPESDVTETDTEDFAESEEEAVFGDEDGHESDPDSESREERE